MNEQDQVKKAFEASPRVLVLGQRFLGKNDRDNPLFRSVQHAAKTELTSYDWWISSSATPEARSELLDKCARSVSMPDALLALRSCPWRCAFSSAIDATPRQLLEVPEKRPVSLALERQDRPDPRFLTLFMLFGSTQRDTLGELPPLTKLDLLNRRGRVDDMLRSLPVVTTPIGHVFIEGWKPSSGDWLTPGMLAPHLLGLASGQVSVFGIDDDERRTLLEDEYFAALVEQNIVALYTSPLHATVAALAAAGDVTLTDPRLEVPDTVAIEVPTHSPGELSTPSTRDLITVTLSQQEYRRLTETFDLLVPRRPSQRVVGTPSELSREFRRFLARTPESNLNYVRQFACRRPVLDETIVPLVVRCMGSPAPQDSTIVLAGQSGAGKSTLLCQLALDLREAAIPVLMVGRRLVPPNYDHMDTLIQEIEAHSSTVTAVIWNGLEEVTEYQKLSRFFASRGRKALVIGSSYAVTETEALHSPESSERRLPDHARSKTHIVPVSVDLSRDERIALLDHFAQFAPDEAQAMSRYEIMKYDNLFALLYYLFDELRPRLQEGLVAEIETQLQRLDARVCAHLEAQKTSSPGMSDLEHALREALGDRLDALAQESVGAEDESVARTVRSEALQLVNAVMLASWLHLDTPQSIALRLLHKEQFLAYRAALEAFPIIRVVSVSDRDVLLGARQRLEAELWCDRRIRDRDARFAIVQRLATRLEAHEARDDRCPELNYVVKLLQAVGPQGDVATRMPNKYVAIAGVTRDLRQKLGELHPRLSLIEANAIRESVQDDQRRVPPATQLDASSLQRQVNEWNARLDKAERALEDAELAVEADETSSRSAGARRFLSVLATERTALIGVKLGCREYLISQDVNRSRKQLDELARLLKRARGLWQRALVIDDENLQALDSACWILRDRMKLGYLTEREECDILGDWSDVIERYSQIDMSPHQFAKFDEREAELARHLEDSARLASIFDRMMQKAPTSAHVLRARFLEQDHDAFTALKYLEEHCSDSLLTDRLVLLLYYRLWWQNRVGQKRFFPEDHLTLDFSSDDWRKLRELAEARLSLAGESDSRLALFHLGWAALQLELGSEASHAFHQLDAVSVGSFRRGRSLAIVSLPEGRPREFFGETRPTAGVSGRAWLDALRIEIPYRPFEFSDVPKRGGEPLGPFHIALNYRGPFAVPVSRSRPARGK